MRFGSPLAPLALAAVLLSGSDARAKGDGCVTDVCHKDLNREKYLHGPVAAGSCRICHARRHAGVKGPGHVKGDMQVPLPKKPLCLKCHSVAAKEFEGKVVHKPVASVSCGFCHDPHQSPIRYLLRKNRAVEKKKPFCFWCHKEHQFQGKFLHKPMTKGCTMCHRVHTASEKRLLKQGLPELCINCHKVQWNKRKFVHGPVDAGMCTACHMPHAANHKKMLREPAPKICLTCHQEEAIDKGHKSVKGFSKACLDCHDPHATNSKYLLKVN